MFERMFRKAGGGRLASSDNQVGMISLGSTSFSVSLALLALGTSSITASLAGCSSVVAWVGCHCPSSIGVWPSSVPGLARRQANSLQGAAAEPLIGPGHQMRAETVPPDDYAPNRLPFRGVSDFDGPGARAVENCGELRSARSRPRGRSGRRGIGGQSEISKRICNRSGFCCRTSIFTRLTDRDRPGPGPRSAGMRDADTEYSRGIFAVGSLWCSSWIVWTRPTDTPWRHCAG